MPRISADRRSDRRRQIANAAMRCFMREGFEATSMADIIAEAGLSAGAIYLHFENKQDLVQQVVRDVLQERTVELAELAVRDPLPDPKEVVAEFVHRVHSGSGPDIRIHVWSTCLREPALASVFEDFNRERLRLISDYLRVWLLRQGLDDRASMARAEPLAQLVLGIAQGFIVQSALVPSLDPDDYLASLQWIDFAPRDAGPAGKGD